MKLNSRKKNIFWFKILIFGLIFYFLIQTFFAPFLVSFSEKINLLILSKEKLKKENLILQKKILQKETENIFSKYFYDKSKSLEKRLSYLEKSEKKRVLKTITFDKKDFLYHSWVAENNNEKIEIGSKVYFFDNFLFGKVVDLEKNFLKIRDFSDYNFQNNFLILENNEVVFRGVGYGDSNGLIKIELPRNLKLDKNSFLVLDDGSGDLVGKFYRDDFKSQNISREVYFKMIKNPKNIFEVEINLKAYDKEK